MRVVVQKAYGPFSVGHVFEDMPANQARTMIARGMVAQDEDHIEGRAMRAPADRMMRAGDAVNKGGKRNQGKMP